MRRCSARPGAGQPGPRPQDTGRPCRARWTRLGTAGALAALLPWNVAAQTPGAGAPSLTEIPSNTFGMPGLIDTPSAVPMPDGTFAFSFSGLAGTQRATLAFQITPRITGAFRYSRIERPRLDDRLFDRSFDLQVQVLQERPGRPGIALGLRDFIGTGEYSSEYIVATGQITPQMRVSGGIGWGRMASGDSFRNPLGLISDRFDTRPGGFTGTGGRLEVNRFFRGRAALFGGIEYQVTDRLKLMAEYSADAYRNETPGAGWDRSGPISLGARYAVSERTSLIGFVLHGGTVGLGTTIALHPDRPVTPVRPTAPVPVAVRATAGQAAAGWGGDSVAAPDALRAEVTRRFADDGLRLLSLELAGDRVVARFANERHEAPARAIGRAARLLTVTMPAPVEEFVLVSTARGIPVSAVTLRRRDLEALEHAPDGSERLLQRAVIADGHGAGRPTGLLVPHPQGQPRLGWSLLPYLAPAIMDPSAPVRADVGLRAEARYALAANLSITGALQQRLAGNLSGTTQALEACRDDGFCYERVRSEAPLYSSSRPVLERLSIDHFSRPGPDLFARLSAGWLERMYAGVSAEVLWKPAGSRLALGAEVNRVRRRAPGQFLGFTGYEVTTGHVSAYYEFGRGFVGQVDVGQYLAGDRGATVQLMREFASGWQIGAYATLTDMPFSAFGEGSFDKGIVLTIPVTWFDGSPSRSRNSQTIRSLTRDGGARLQLTDRLYPTVRSVQRRALEESWGTVWQ